jgi:hypothetical protein
MPDSSSEVSVSVVTPPARSGADVVLSSEADDTSWSNATYGPRSRPRVRVRWASQRGAGCAGPDSRSTERTVSASARPVNGLLEES